MGYCFQAATDEIVMMTPRALHAHQRQNVLAGHDGAAQVDGGDAVECRLSDLVERRVPAGDAYADIVVEDVDAAPTPS